MPYSTCNSTSSMRLHVSDLGCADTAFLQHLCTNPSPSPLVRFLFCASSRLLFAVYHFYPLCMSVLSSVQLIVVTSVHFSASFVQIFVVYSAQFLSCATMQNVKNREWSIPGVKAPIHTRQVLSALARSKRSKPYSTLPKSAPLSLSKHTFDAPAWPEPRRSNLQGFA